MTSADTESGLERVTARERAILAVLGALALAALAVLAWQRRPVPLTITAAPAPSLDQARDGALSEVDGAPSAAWDGRLADARQVDVNTADASELERLPGVGSALARRIVEDRESHGAFSSVEDLTRVRGIGPETRERLEPYVTVE